MEFVMTISVVRFGDILTSRPEGREAALVCLANKIKVTEPVELDFEGVLVMTPLMAWRVC